jgi:membrane fusion protein (multidrug efflux system)
MKTARVLVGVGLFVFLGVAAGGLYLFKLDSIRAAASAPAFEPAEAVTITPAGTRRWQPTADLVGTVVALRSVALQNELAGQVRRVGFESGQIVEPGQVLVELDDSTDRADLRSAEAALRVAQAEVDVVEARIRLAESDLTRQEAAARSGATSESELDRARAEVARERAERLRAAASVDEERARIEQVKTRLDKLVIRAPFRARVGLRTVHEGQFLAVPMGMDSVPIATLQEVADDIYIDFAVPQEQVGRVQIGMSVDGVREGAGAGDAARRAMRLEVVAIDAQANNVTRNVRVRARVDNREGALRPGMFVLIRVPTEEPRTFVTVPVTAVRRASYADQVFVVRKVQEPGPDGAPVEKMRAEQRFVKLGPTLGDEVVVLEGLEAGEPVAASGSFKLRPDALVMPAPPAGAPPPAAGAVPQSPTAG